jgi:hypothetical protein
LKVTTLTCHRNSDDDQSVLVLDKTFREFLDKGDDLGVRPVMLDDPWAGEIVTL